MNYCPQCRAERQEKIPPEASTRICSFHAAELALHAGVAQYTDQHGKPWLLTSGVRSGSVPEFFNCLAGGCLPLLLHYSDIEVGKT